MKKFKSKIGLENIIVILFYIELYLYPIYLQFLQYWNNIPSKMSASDALILVSIIFLFPPTPFLLFFYYNSFIEIDIDNKLVRVRKLLWKYNTIKLNGNERYIIRRIRGRLDFCFVYVIDDEKVLFSYQNIFNSNWNELEEGLNNMGIFEVPYDGFILFRDLFRMRI